MFQDRFGDLVTVALGMVSLEAQERNRATVEEFGDVPQSLGSLRGLQDVLEPSERVFGAAPIGVAVVLRVAEFAEV